jgi:AraC-like DNA-binding protein
MPLFMDFHRIENITIDDVINAHMADVSIQEKYGVVYHQFWVNQKAGTVFCLTEGPDAETCEKVHQMAHGNMACAITEVEPGYFSLLMGDSHLVDHGVVKNHDGSVDIGYRNIVVTSIRGITTAIDSNNLDLLQIPAWARQVVLKKVQEFGGREVKWDFVGCIVGVFNDASDAVSFACEVQKFLSGSLDAPKVTFKVGISADQPVTENGEFFARAIRLAHTLCNTADDNQIVASSLVKKISEARKNVTALRYLDQSEEQFVGAIHELAQKNLSNKDFTVDTLCREIGISRPQLYRKMTSITGRAPNNFLRDIRMENALRLLRDRAGNISQIALEVGYNNPSYFSKCFAEKFGCSPSNLTLQHA